MKIPYKMSDIKWDVDSEEDANDLPSVVWAEVEATFDEMVKGGAANFLSDRYGFCVKSCRVERAKKPETRKMFMVEAHRTEHYVARMNVLANSKKEAERIMEQRDHDDFFCDVWNEAQPEVETKYVAEPSPRPELGEGVL